MLRRTNLSLLDTHDESGGDQVDAPVGQTLEVEVRFAGGTTARVSIEEVQDQGPPITVTVDAIGGASGPAGEIDGLDLLDGPTLRRSLTTWARTAPDEKPVLVVCLHSRWRRLLELLDPDKTGVRPIPIEAISSD